MAIAEGWERPLAYFCTISKLYDNGIIYDYSSRSLGHKLSVSKNTANSIVKKLTEIGLLVKEGRHLRCSSKEVVKAIVEQRTGRPTGKGLLTIKVHKSIKHTEWNILARVPLNSLRQQKYKSFKRSEANVISKKANSSSGFVTRKELRKLREWEKSSTKQAEKLNTGDLCFLSDRTISRLSNGRSISNVRAMFKFWEEQGLVTGILHKGRSIESHLSPRSYEALKQERSEFKDTYYFKGRAIQFNKRSLDYGTNVGRRDLYTCKGVC